MNIGIDFEQFKKQETTIVMSNYTKVPNFLIDEQFMASMSGNAFKCLHFIIRQTIGFGRTQYDLPENLVRKMTGIKNKDTFYAAIRELEQLKLVSVSREKGKVNTYSIKLDYSGKTGVLTKNSTTKKPECSSPENHEYSTPEKPETLKETLKENFKEIYPLESEQKKSSVDDVLNLWVPNLSSLNAWLQRAGEKAMSQDEVNHWLVEINAHYEPRIKVGLVSENQMYSNFVKWVKRNHKKPKHSQHPEKPQSAKQQRDDAWAEYYAKRNQQQPNNIIDVVEVKHV